MISESTHDPFTDPFTAQLARYCRSPCSTARSAVAFHSYHPRLRLASFLCCHKGPFTLFSLPPAGRPSHRTPPQTAERDIVRRISDSVSRARALLPSVVDGTLLQPSLGKETRLVFHRVPQIERATFSGPCLHILGALPVARARDTTWTRIHDSILNVVRCDAVPATELRELTCRRVEANRW